MNNTTRREIDRFVMLSSVFHDWTPDHRWTNAPSEYSRSTLVLQVDRGLVVKLISLREVDDYFRSLSCLGVIVRQVVWYWPCNIAGALQHEFKDQHTIDDIYAIDEGVIGNAYELCLAATRTSILHRKVLGLGLP